MTQGGGTPWLSRGLLQLDDIVGAHTDYNEEEEEQNMDMRNERSQAAIVKQSIVKAHLLH